MSAGTAHLGHALLDFGVLYLPFFFFDRLSLVKGTSGVPAEARSLELYNILFVQIAFYFQVGHDRMMVINLKAILFFLFFVGSFFILGHGFEDAANMFACPTLGFRLFFAFMALILKNYTIEEAKKLFS
mmetsp:Transcript_40736/g.62176  ORF Transcript_40736/g.62176 Transcript_40736/m.62176 type:complete len:129 (-) Transcript_40736:776-1162(-)